MKGKARATHRTLNKVGPVSDKKPVGFESVQTDLGASTSRTQRKGSGRPSAPVPTNEAATSAVARTGVASRSSSAPVPTNEVVASVVVQTDISDADQTASTSRSLFGLRLPKDLVFTKKGKSLPQPRFSISWTPGQNVLEHSTDRWSIFRDGLEENSLISDTRISSIEEALKKSFPGKYKDGINLIYVELSADFKPLNQDPFPNHQWSDLYRFPGIHPQAIAANLHATNTQWPRLNDESTPSHLLIYPFAPSWDFTHFPVLYDRSRPWRSYSLVVRTDPWNENISWYEDYKILEPEWLIQREKIASRLKQCVLVFKTVSNIADFVSLSLPKPDECKFDVLKDWDRLLDRRPCRDLLEFGQRYQKAPDPPMFDDTEEGLAKFEATHERYDREEREAQHHPYGALLIARAYLGIGEAQREVGNIIAGMAGKNVRSTTWGSKRQTPLERYCMRKWANPVKLDKTEFSRRQQLSREYLQLIGEFTEPQANPIPVTANEDTGVAGSLQAKTRGPVKEFVEPPTHSAAAAASGIMGLAGPLQTRMHDPVSQTHGGEQSAPLHMSGASGSGSMELDEGRREVGSRTTQHSASRVETRSYRCPSGPIGRRWDAQKHLSDALNRRPARGRVLARDRETYHDHPRHWQPPHDKREDRRGDYHRRSMMSRSRSPVRHRRNSSSPPSLRRHRSPFSFPFSRRRHHSHSSSRSCRRSHSPHSRSHSRSRSPDRSRSRSRPRSYSVSRCLQSSHRRSRSASCPPSPLGPSRQVASPIEMQVDVPSSNPRPLPQPGCHLSQQVPVLRMIQPHSIPFTSWHCLTTPLEDKHFQAFGKADLDVWAAPLFEVRGVYAVAQAKASKSALKYGKTRIAILAKHRDVLDRVTQLISENNAHYHALLAFAIFSPLDPFSGKEAASYSWVSKVDLHFVGCVWESVPFEELRSRLLTDAPLVLTNDNVGEELLYHGFDPLVSTEAQATPRNVKLHSFDFSPHVLDAWYDTMPLQFKSYGVTRFMFVARAYDSALFKGRKAFMAEIWRTESVIDAALRNLLEYLCENSQDVICRESKEKTESFQYLRGQRKWRLTVDTAIKDYCPYFKVK
ncbi:uncharacterized protein EI90DRAFT_3131230 [Cantharellus anzutake]|uniref:uncharacterized protein n=1 Tax=Cantharellus anzutake TaxID=1750568 RepID=UPI0019033314|nr:uncharacterized protein EI90DRAFT_3131230 [Cantharellus anzutake]KAF8321983.1 hypothetical protein EI90DRAFT_3131230 [Cantharellus anzutake]